MYPDLPRMGVTRLSNNMGKLEFNVQMCQVKIIVCDNLSVITNCRKETGICPKTWNYAYLREKNKVENVRMQ